MRCLNKVLGISWSDKIEKKYTNKEVHNSFYNTKNIDSLLTKERLTFLRILVRMQYNNISARLLSLFCKKKSPLGSPNFTVQHSMSIGIRKRTLLVNDNGSISSWAHIANNEILW